MMKKNFLLTALAFASMALMLTGSVSAEEQTAGSSKSVSENGAVTITLPTAEWTEVASNEACVCFSNGNAAILFDHYSMNDSVPVIDAVGEDNIFFYQTIETANAVKYVFTAYTSNKSELTGIKYAIAGAEVNAEKLPKEEKHEVVADQYSVEPADYTAYVTVAQLNVRPEGNTNSAPLGYLQYRDPVKITGIVSCNGVQTGWVQVDFNGMKGYVSYEFLSTSQPIERIPETETPGTNKTPDPNHPESVGVVIVRNSSEQYFELTRYDDDSVLDDNGDQYIGIRLGVWENQTTGELFYDANYQSHVYDDETPEYEYHADFLGLTIAHNDLGRYVELSSYSDGTIKDENGDYYMAAGPGYWENLTTGEIFHE